ncbi:MAG: GHKL domain-containing protein, partial [Nitrospinaceae bacterium]|nr:GHKL domain-containing protein [Nitrospinaceae bacterium]NIR55662.1 GHKL domain-containing protein [Nitrospinaceae bacterium]NIS86106.1 GHKL domain-containing protein [Nitrospinaceae bacterium]NIT82950.1 GHKL domain-containing protein [Nitrospinaceae bacterium]NIU45153.1 GHKL domain-containing protein [Nitrospinaceae bacterium]
ERKQPVNLNQALETTLVVSRNEWKYVAEIEKDFDPQLPPVLCLVNDINQVFLNLVVNAAHAIESRLETNGASKGIIRIATRKLEDGVEIRIEDNGMGIPPDIQNRIFDPFFTTKEVGKGTGLGLSIVHSVVVKKHRGTVSFETEPGQGTTFIVRLPFSRTEETAGAIDA